MSTKFPYRTNFAQRSFLIVSTLCYCITIRRSFQQETSFSLVSNKRPLQLASLPEPASRTRDAQKAAQNVFPPTTTVISVMYIYRGVEQQGENESAVLAELSSN